MQYFDERICPRCDEPDKEYNNHKQYCIECYNTEQREAYKKHYYLGSSKWININTATCKRRATKLDVPFNEQDIRELLENCPTHCPVFGTEFILGTGIGPKQNSPTIERIIPDLGYVSGNILMICWKANRLKNNSSLEELQQIVEWLQENLRAT